MENIKTVNKFINNDDIDIKRHLIKKEEEEKKQNIEFLLDLIRKNPNITEEMINSPKLKACLGEAKREYKKEILASEHRKSR